MSLFNELKRRNVIRVAIAYVVVAWLILQVADVILNNVDAPAWVFWVTLLLLGSGFIVVVVFSWAFELTPEGLKRESEVDRTQSISHVTARKLDRLVTIVLVLALGYFVADKFLFSTGRQDAAVEAALEQAEVKGPGSSTLNEPGPVTVDKSIAVLPFVNMSSDPEQEYFSDGLSEELLNLLAKVPELRVAARTSSFSLKGKDLQIAEIGKTLNVAHVLEGSVRKSGDQVRITAQLIRSDNGYHMWSETFDRKLDDVFSIQDEIASEVVRALKLTLLGGAAPTVSEADPEAYALVLQARHYLQQRSNESLERAIGVFQQALEIEPGYADAWAGLAQVYAEQALSDYRPREEGFRLSLEAAEQALASNPDHAPAHAALSRVAMFQNRIQAAARHMQQALELDPANVNIITEAAVLVELLGRPEKAIRLLQFVVARDPVNADAHAGLGRSYRVTSRWDEAIESYRTSLALSPERYGSHQGIGESLLFMGEYEAAMAEYAQEPDEEWMIKGIALCLHGLGRMDEFNAKFTELRERWGDTWPSEIAHVYAYIGDKDQAFEWLNRAVAKNEDGLFQQYYQPLLRPLHDDPRWGEFRERTIGRVETLAGVQFEVSLPQ